MKRRVFAIRIVKRADGKYTVQDEGDIGQEPYVREQGQWDTEDEALEFVEKLTEETNPVIGLIE